MSHIRPGLVEEEGLVPKAFVVVCRTWDMDVLM